MVNPSNTILVLQFYCFTLPLPHYIARVTVLTVTGVCAELTSQEDAGHLLTITLLC